MKRFTVNATTVSAVSLDIMAVNEAEAIEKARTELRDRRVEKAGLSEKIESFQLGEVTSQSPRITTTKITEKDWDLLEDQIRVWFGIVGIFHRDDYNAIDTHQEFKSMTGEMDFGNGNKVLYINAVRCGDDVVFVLSTCQISEQERIDIGVFLDTDTAAKEEYEERAVVTSFYYRTDLLERLRALKHKGLS